MRQLWNFCGDLSWYGAPSVLEHGPCASADGTHAGRPVPSGCSGAGGGLAEAEALTQKAQEHWQSNVSYLRFVQFHEEIDEVTVLLKEAKGFLWDREVGEYTAMSVRIYGKLEAMCGLETISAGNLF